MRIKNYKQSILIYTLIFAGLFAAAYAGFFGSGRTFVTKVDGVDQYYMGFCYFGKYLRELIKGLLSGSPSLPLYDLGIGMGEDILGSLNYYGFGDPLYLMSVFAVGQAAPFIYSMSFFIRLYLAGLAFFAYCRQMGVSPLAALAGVFCFVVNGFTYGGVSSYMGWASVLIYLPLMLTAVERIFKGQRGGRRIMLLASFYAAMCGFYFLYMSCVFLVVYCIGRGLALFGVRGLLKAFTSSITAALFLVLGILLAGPVFFPSVSGFMGSERADISILGILTDPASWTPYLPVYRSFINDPARYYFKYICKITVAEYAALIMAFFLPRSRAKAQLCIADTVILLVVALPVTGYIFSGFGESGFEVNVRWAFLIHFVFSITLVWVLDHFPFPGDAKRSRSLASAAALAIVLVSTGMVVFGNSAAGVGRIDVDNLARNMDSPVLRSEVIAADGDVYRISLDRFMTTSDRPENSAMIHGYYGITYWLSIMNNYTQYASDEIKGESQEWRSDGFSHLASVETAMGVKYYLGKGDNPVPDGYVERESFDYYGESWHVYENTNWYSLAAARDPHSADRAWEDKQDYVGYFEEISAWGAQDSGISSLSYDNRRNVMKITTSPEAKSQVVVSLPYSEGWEVRVDGSRVDTCVRDLMCLAFDTGGGSHEIELAYHSRGFEAGCLASLLTLAGLIIFIAAGKRRIRSAAAGKTDHSE